MRPRLRALWFVVLMTVCIGCDRVTKDAAVEHLREAGPVSLAGGIVHLEYVENPGAFMSFGDELGPEARFWVLVVGTSVILAAVGVILIRRRASLSRAAFVSLSLILAGGLGNLFDRIVAGYVVDFVRVGIGPVRTGIFNVADVAITTGAIGILLAGWLDRSSDGSRHAPA